MAVLVLIGHVLLGLAVVTAVSRNGGRNGSSPRPEADLLFVLGISLSGIGTVLMATIGPGMVGLVAFGTFFIGVGSRRMRNSSHRGSR